MIVNEKNSSALLICLNRFEIQKYPDEDDYLSVTNQKSVYYLFKHSGSISGSNLTTERNKKTICFDFAVHLSS